MITMVQNEKISEFPQLYKKGTKMEIPERIKQLSKMTKKQAGDVAELKKLLVESKGNKREVNAVISRMIVRVETTWADLRGLGRVINNKKDKNEKKS